MTAAGSETRRVGLAPKYPHPLRRVPEPRPAHTGGPCGDGRPNQGGGHREGSTRARSARAPSPGTNHRESRSRPTALTTPSAPITVVRPTTGDAAPREGDHRRAARARTTIRSLAGPRPTASVSGKAGRSSDPRKTGVLHHGNPARIDDISCPRVSSDRGWNADPLPGAPASKVPSTPPAPTTDPAGWQHADSSPRATSPRGPAGPELTVRWRVPPAWCIRSPTERKHNTSIRKRIRSA